MEFLEQNLLEYEKFSTETKELVTNIYGDLG
jgi:hypothetical protein